MIEVQCYSGKGERALPASFRLNRRTYKVVEVMDRWYGESLAYFKIKADDENIYLLKNDRSKNLWDLVFYQNPRKVSGNVSEVSGVERLMPYFSFKNSRNENILLN